MPTATRDYARDPSGREVYRLVKQYDSPEFVKFAELSQVMDTSHLATTVYADPVRRVFPCHTAAATWLSAANFEEKRAEYHPNDAALIEQRLNRYADQWRIRPAIDQVRAKCASARTAPIVPDSDFAYVWVDDATGNKDRRLSLRSPFEVKAAADWLAQYRDQIPFAIRHTIAGKILTKAAEFGAAIGPHMEDLEKQAGRGVCDPHEVAVMLEKRAMLASTPEEKAEIVKLAELLKAAKPATFQPGMLIDLCQVVEAVDTRLGLLSKYSAALPRPEDVIFKVTFTKAASTLTEHCATTSGTVYKTSDFSKLALDDVRSLFGTDFAAQVQTGLDDVDPEKMAEVVATLPRPDAELFDRLMADAQLSPAAVKAASVPQGFSPIDYVKLAEAYVS